MTAVPLKTIKAASRMAEESERNDRVGDGGQAASNECAVSETAALGMGQIRRLKRPGSFPSSRPRFIPSPSHHTSSLKASRLIVLSLAASRNQPCHA